MDAEIVLFSIIRSFQGVSCLLLSQVTMVTLTQPISLFGIPKVLQSGQGTNFTSCMFADNLKDLHIKHAQSTAYHPESQEVIKQFHQIPK